jgi:general secretion pathway protein G
VRAAITFCLAILGILALWFYVVRPKLGSNHEARSMVAYADVHGGFKIALDAYVADNGSYPKSLQDLVKQPSGATNWHGPYFGSPKDPWGHKYIYEYPGKHNTNGYDLSSAGMDGKPGTDDDICNW